MKHVQKQYTKMNLDKIKVVNPHYVQITVQQFNLGNARDYVSCVQLIGEKEINVMKQSKEGDNDGLRSVKYRLVGQETSAMRDQSRTARFPWIR